MYLSYFGMEFNPFDKEIDTKYRFETDDFKVMNNRLNYIKDNPGIGLFTGSPGLGKTFIIRNFLKGLNPNLYKVIYISMSSITVLEFYKAIAYELGIEPAFRKIDLFRQIQESIMNYVKNKKQEIIICVDEAQYLKNGIINDLKMLMNFEMDSKNYFTLILIGQPFLNTLFNRGIHEAVRQRITVSYNLLGISKEELKEYIYTRLDISHGNKGIFSDQAIEAIFNSCSGSIRIVNNIITKSLIIASNKSRDTIDTETIMEAVNELALG